MININAGMLHAWYAADCPLRLELLESSALQGATLGLDLATLAGVLLAASPGPRIAGAAFVYTILKC